jgi:hypothetical protein
MRIYVHPDRKALYGAFDSAAPITLPTLIQGGVETIELVFIKDAADPTPVAPWDYNDLPTGETPSLAVCGTPGHPNGTTAVPKVEATDWTFTAGTHLWSALLDLNDPIISTLIGDDEKKTTTLEIATANTTDVVKKHAHALITIEAEVIDMPRNITTLLNVADDTHRLALTSADVDNGNLVHVQEDHHLYIVLDNSDLTDESNWDDLGDVMPFAPSTTAVPTITGTAQVGVELTANEGTWEARPTSAHSSWQWQRSDNGTTGWANITSATASTYTPVAGDHGKYLRVQETESNAVSTTTANSTATAAVLAA